MRSTSSPGVYANGQTLALIDTSTLTESGGPSVAATLTGKSSGGATLYGANQDRRAGRLDRHNRGHQLQPDTSALKRHYRHCRNAGTNGAVVLTDSGTISESGAGVIDAGSLAGSAGGAVTLLGANKFAILGAFFTDVTSVAITDKTAVTINGLVNTGSLALTDTSTIAEGSGGAIDTASFSGSSSGGATLTGANAITAITGYTDTAGAISLDDTSALNITGVINNGTKTLTLIDTGGAISEGSAGVIDTGTFTGSSNGGAALTGANKFGTLGAYSDAGANASVALPEGQALGVNGPVTVANGAISRTTAAGSLTVAGAVTAKTLTIVTPVKALETAAGAITVTTINVTAGTGITLTSPLNAIVNIGVDTTTSGSNTITK